MKLGIRQLCFVAVMIGLLAAAYFLVFTKQDVKRRARMEQLEQKQVALHDLDRATASVHDVDRKIKELQDTTLVERTAELAEITGGSMGYDIDWDSFADDLEDGLDFRIISRAEDDNGSFAPARIVDEFFGGDLVGRALDKGRGEVLLKAAVGEGVAEIDAIVAGITPAKTQGLQGIEVGESSDGAGLERAG